MEQMVGPFSEDVPAIPNIPTILAPTGDYSTEEKRILLLSAAIGETFGGEPIRVDDETKQLVCELAREYGSLVRETLTSTYVEARSGGYWTAEESAQVRLSTSAPSWCWWTSPNYVNSYGSDEPALWMTSPLFKDHLAFPSRVSLGWLCQEDSTMDPEELLNDEPAELLYEARRPESTRMLTIGSRADFHHLVERFLLMISCDHNSRPDLDLHPDPHTNPYPTSDPGPAPQVRHQLRELGLAVDPIEVLVDWPRVAEHYDAVYMPFEGYMDCAWVPIRTSRGLAIAAGWAPEATYWLTAPAVQKTPPASPSA